MADTQELLGTREAARLLGIHEKQVYALVKAGRIPGSRLTGKWVFPRRLLLEHIEEDARRTVAAAPERSRRAAGFLLAAGSNDPLLDVLSSALQQDRPPVYLFTASTGSSAGLRALNLGHTDMAWSHLRDPQTGEYNLPLLPALLPRLKPVVVAFFHRDIGLLTPPRNPLRLRAWKDLGRAGLRIVNRQPGSGTRVLLDEQLARLGRAARPAGYDREVSTHAEVALAVRAGQADAGVGTESAARMFGLCFVPLARERFDIVLDQPLFFEPAFQRLMQVLGSVAFRARVAPLGGYDLRDCGKVLLGK
jgi:putative molybdopterin biosynthesis protein